MIEIQGLVKRYGRFTAVDELSLTIPRGSVYGFVGPNGAGKTTTMRILATLLLPTSGKVTVAGVDVLKKPLEARKALGYMPDFFGVYDNLTVMEYLRFYGDAQAVPKEIRDRTAGELLELISLSDKRDAFVDSLSRGMKQRLCLARSLMHNPQALILDEPASGMDPRARAEMRGILMTLKDMGKTVLISSHILPELSEMCDHMAILEKGKLVVAGTMQEIQRRMGGARPLMIRAIGDLEPLAKRLLEKPETGGVERVGEDTLRVAFEDDDEKAEALLREIVAAGARIVEFSRANSNLEKIFLEVTGDVHE